MNYLLNNLEDIEAVYIPNIQSLKDEWIRNLSNFPKSDVVIVESMKFIQYFFYGDDYEKEYLSFRDFDFKNKNHKYYGINYDYLIENIDADTFKLELEGLIYKQENNFIEEIERNCNEVNSILFEKSLKEKVSNLLNSKSSLESLTSSSNSFQKIIIDKYLSSYNNVYSNLERAYKPYINNKEIFKSVFSDHFIFRNKSYSNSDYLTLSTLAPNDNYSFPFKKSLSDQMELYNYKNVLNKNSKIISEGKKANWKKIVDLMFEGTLLVLKIEKKYQFIFAGEEFYSISALGNKVAVCLEEKKDTIRPIITDSFYDSQGTKNIFVKNHKSYLKDKLEKDDSKICSFFKQKVVKLISNEN